MKNNSSSSSNTTDNVSVGNSSSSLCLKESQEKPHEVQLAPIGVFEISSSSSESFHASSVSSTEQKVRRQVYLEDQLELSGSSKVSSGNESLLSGNEEGSGLENSSEDMLGGIEMDLNYSIKRFCNYRDELSNYDLDTRDDQSGLITCEGKDYMYAYIILRPSSISVNILYRNALWNICNWYIQFRLVNSTPNQDLLVLRAIQIIAHD